MPSHNALPVYYPRSLPDLPTFPQPPPLTITGKDLARMVPPMPTTDFDFSQELISSDEEVEEAKAELPCKSARPRTKKCPTKTKAVAQKPPRKPDTTRGRDQKKRAASAQAKKAAAAPKTKNAKKAGT